MINTDTAASGSEAEGRRIDRPVLVGNAVSGAAWLLLALVLTRSVPLILVGAAYVAVASVFLAAVYGREVLTRGQEALAWAAPWIGAMALWTWVLASIDDGGADSHGFVALHGLVIGSLSYLGWQVGALAVRQLLSRSPSGPHS